MDDIKLVKDNSTLPCGGDWGVLKQRQVETVKILFRGHDTDI